MAVIHISEEEAIRDITRVLAKVKGGEQVIIGDGNRTVAVVQPPSAAAYPRFSEVLRLAEGETSQVLLDDQFGRDLQEIIERYSNEPRIDLWKE